MRKIGIILIVVGLAGFLVATSQRGGYDTVEGAIKTTFSQKERSQRDLWDTARWLFVGTGVVGIILTVLPGKKE
jgi:hypothetical protein